MLPGFEHIARVRDDRHKIWLAKIHPGDICVTTSTEGVTTILGSCVAACVRDTRTGVGGMNHFMRPLAADSADDGADAMERLVSAVLAHGSGERARLELKLVGASQLRPEAAEIGPRALQFARQFAAAAKLPIVAEDVGGALGRDVVYWPGTGQLQIRKLRGIQTLLAEREREYGRLLNSRETGAPEGRVG